MKNPFKNPVLRTASLMLIPLAFYLATVFLPIPSLFNKMRDQDIGIVVLTHGSSSIWNKAIKEAVNNIRGNFKKEIAFGMGDAAIIQTRADSLIKNGAKSIIVIPLFLSSSSEMYRQIEYVTHRRNEPDVLFWLLTKGYAEKHETHSSDHDNRFGFIRQIHFGVPYIVLKPIDYHPLVARILEEKIKESGLMKEKDLSIIIVAHGPVSEDDDKAWLINLNLYAYYLADKIKKVNFFAYTARDDAPWFIKDRAIERITQTAEIERRKGRKPLIVTYLLAPGGRELAFKTIIESHCSCRILPLTILPHKNITEWMEEKIREGKMLLNQKLNN